MWQTLLDDFLGDGLMLRNGALDQCDGLPKDSDVALQDAFHLVVCGKTMTGKALPVEMRIDGIDGCNAAVYGQACIFGIVLRVLHFSS